MLNNPQTWYNARKYFQSKLRAQIRTRAPKHLVKGSKYMSITLSYLQTESLGNKCSHIDKFHNPSQASSKVILLLVWYRQILLTNNNSIPVLMQCMWKGDLNSQEKLGPRGKMASKSEDPRQGKTKSLQGAQLKKDCLWSHFFIGVWSYLLLILEKHAKFRQKYGYPLNTINKLTTQTVSVRGGYFENFAQAIVTPL